MPQPPAKRMPHLRVHLGFTTASDTSTLETGQAVHDHLYTSTAWVVPPNPAFPVTAAALDTAVESFSSAIAAAQMGGPDYARTATASRYPREKVHTSV